MNEWCYNEATKDRKGDIIMSVSNNEDRRLPKGTKPHIISIAEAFVLVKDLYQHGGGQGSRDLLSKITGNSQSSSSFVRKLNALKAYGLLAEQGADQFTLTETGIAIAAPQTSEAEANAKKQTFLKVEVFNRIYERHKGKLLPADEFLRNIIEQDCGIPREWSETWAEEFKMAAHIVGLLRTRNDGNIQILESAILSDAPIVVSPPPQPAQILTPTTPKSELSEDLTANFTMPFAASGHISKIKISGDRYAIFTMPDHLTARDAQKLKGALNGLSQIIDSMIEEEDSG